MLLKKFKIKHIQEYKYKNKSNKLQKQFIAFYISFLGKFYLSVILTFVFIIYK